MEHSKPGWCITSTKGTWMRPGPHLQPTWNMRFPLSIARKTDGALYITRFAAHRDVRIFCQANEAPAGSLEYVGLHVEASGNSLENCVRFLETMSGKGGRNPWQALGPLKSLVEARRLVSGQVSSLSKHVWGCLYVWSCCETHLA